MNIDSNGLTLDTLDDLMNAFETLLRAKYGDDFYIKAEGVIDNIFTSVSFQMMNLQEQIAYLSKQIDPATAEGQFQDALYERLLCYRIKGANTIVERTIVGTPNLLVKAGQITIRNSATLDEFINKDDVTIGEDGQIVADFECVLTGAIELPVNAEIEVIALPIGVTTVITGENPRVDLGRDRETNEEYRTRFKNAKNINARATRNANYDNLSKYVDDLSYLNILDKKTDLTMEPGTIQIIVNHNTTSTVFGNAIFNTIADGIETLGTTEVTVKDNGGNDVLIKWLDATFEEIQITADIKIKTGYYPTSVLNDVKTSIIDYINNRIYGLGQTVYANEFIIPIYKTDGVENVSNMKIKIGESGNWSDELNIGSTSLAMFSREWINLNEIS